MLTMVSDADLENLCLTNQYYYQLCQTKVFLDTKLKQLGININDVDLTNKPNYLTLYFILTFYKQLDDDATDCGNINVTFEDIQTTNVKPKDYNKIAYDYKIKHPRADMSTMIINKIDVKLIQSKLKNIIKLLKQHHIGYKQFINKHPTDAVSWYSYKDWPVMNFYGIITLRPRFDTNFMNFFIDLLYNKYIKITTIEKQTY